MLMFLHTLAHTAVSHRVSPTNDIDTKKVEYVKEIIVENAWYIFKVVVLASICLALLVIANFEYFVANMHQIRNETDDTATHLYLLSMQIVHGSTCVLMPSAIFIYILAFRVRDIVVICYGEFVGKRCNIDNKDPSYADISRFAATPIGKYTAHYNAALWDQHECPILMQPFDYSSTNSPSRARILYCGHMFSKSAIESYEAGTEPTAFRGSDEAFSTPRVWRRCPVCKDWYDCNTMRYPFDADLNKGYCSLWVDYEQYGITGI